MFTLGDKLRVLNSNSHVKILAGNTTARTSTATYAVGGAIPLSGDVTAADTVSVEGFHSFPISAIADMKVRRYSAPVGEITDWTVVAPAGLAVGDAVEVQVYAKTTRYQSELKNNFIGAVRPITFATAPLTAITPIAITAAIVQAFADRGFTFNQEASYIGVAQGASTSKVRFTIQPGYESVDITKVELKRSNIGIGDQFPLALAKTGITTGSEGNGTGKFLEESVSMATWANSNPYGVDNASTRVDIRGGYTEVTFTLNSSYNENLSTLAADHGPLTAKHRFTIFLNEATCLGANNAISLFAATAIIAAGANAGSTATAQSAPLTRAQESSESLILASQASTNTVALFIA